MATKASTTRPATRDDGTDILLDVRDLTTEFATQSGPVHALNGISYVVRAGETLGFVGESGSGKSVTAMNLVRLIPSPPGRVVAGEIVFRGQDLLAISDEQMRKVRGKEIGVIFQDPMTALNPVLTVGRQITESLRLHLKMTRKEARVRAIELLELVGIPAAETRVDDYPHQFSGGMRQRVMIAMAVSCNPLLLIADEPTTALDVTVQAQILELIGKLRDELGTAVIMITHDLGVVAGMTDRVNVMYAGRIVESADTEDLFDDPRHPYTLGLMRSMPSVAERKDRLIPIEGMPPDMSDPPPGCPFATRCEFAVDRCRTEVPPLIEVGVGHWSACWVDPRGEERSA